MAMIRRAVAVGAFLAAATSGCVGDSVSALDGGGDGGSSESGSCATGTKSCGGQCVQVNDPKFGCDPTACAPCPADTAKHQAAACDANGKCAFSSMCDTGFGDCDMNPANGCETNLQSDVANCGACKNVCGTANTSAVACNAGKCAPTCNAGMAHCTAKDSDGCETNIAGSDSKNCGACGHDCQGGACAAGVCQILPLSTSENKPNGLAVDPGTTGNVYWGQIYFNGSGLQNIRVIQKNGMGLNKLFDAPSTAQGTTPFIAGVAQAGNYVYWTVFACNSTRTNVYFGAKNGAGSAQMVTDGANGGWNGPSGITSDSTSVYFTVRGCGGPEGRNIMSAPIGSTTATTVLTDNSNTAPGSFGIAVEDGSTGSIFWPNTLTGLRKISKNGATNVKLDNQAAFVAINTNNVYYSFGASLYMMGKDGKCGMSMVCPIPLVTFVNGESVNSIAADDKEVYFTAATGGGNPTGHAYRIKADGSQAMPTQVYGGSLPGAMAIDDVAMYFVDQFQGKVLKLAK